MLDNHNQLMVQNQKLYLGSERKVAHDPEPKLLSWSRTELSHGREPKLTHNPEPKLSHG